MAERETWLKNKPYNYHSHLSDIIKGVNKDVFDKFSKYEVEFILKWKNIFDINISSKTKFSKIYFESQKAQTATLFVTAHPANMLEVTYLEGIMQEQIANYFGFKLVNRIKFSPDYNFYNNATEKVDINVNKKSFANADNINKIKVEISSKINDEVLQEKLTELFKNL